MRRSLAVSTMFVLPILSFGLTYGALQYGSLPVAGGSSVRMASIVSYAGFEDSLSKEARMGDPVAQHNLGVMYVTGEGRRQDLGRALNLFRSAAAQGDAASMHSLGLMYERGEGIGRDMKEALVWYRKAADKGFAAAQNNLGAKYFKGEGINKDYAQAAKWFRKAADQGFAAAQNNLGVMYLKGKGLSADKVEAYKWFALAARQSQPGAKDFMTQTSSKLSQRQIAEADARAAQWKPRS